MYVRLSVMCTWDFLSYVHQTFCHTWVRFSVICAWDFLSYVGETFCHTYMRPSVICAWALPSCVSVTCVWDCLVYMILFLSLGAFCHVLCVYESCFCMWAFLSCDICIWVCFCNMFVMCFCPVYVRLSPLWLREAVSILCPCDGFCPMSLWWFLSYYM